MQPHILYEDAYIIIVNKPYGLLSEQADAPNMPAALQAYTGSAVYPVHRLDRTTQGLMLYAKTSDCAKALSAMIQRHEIHKTYLAVVEGVPERESGEMEDLLFFDRRHNKSYVTDRERKGVRRARLSYRTLAATETDGHTLSLLRVCLHTGRTHQIRVQLASRHMPIAGDRRYGSRIKADNIQLCSCRLYFLHPISGAQIDITYHPEDGFFGKFQENR